MWKVTISRQLFSFKHEILYILKESDNKWKTCDKLNSSDLYILCIKIVSDTKNVSYDMLKLKKVPSSTWPKPMIHSGEALTDQTHWWILVCRVRVTNSESLPTNSPPNSEVKTKCSILLISPSYVENSAHWSICWYTTDFPILRWK